MLRWALYGGALGTGAPVGLWLLLKGLDASLERALWVAYAYSGVATVAVFLLFGLFAGARMRRLGEAAIFDPLTGLCNRRFLAELLSRLLAGARRGRRELALLMIDLDRFKEVNDRHGHAVGDRTLAALAAAFAAATREADLVGRFGGEEFLVVCPDTGGDAAVEAAERLRRAAREVAPKELGWAGPQTVSIGVAVFGSDLDEGAAALVQRADRALYRAKAEGRDRGVLAAPPRPERRFIAPVVPRGPARQADAG
jgi:diguanylate cyclase (GGDEF)-like protein